MKVFVLTINANIWGKHERKVSAFKDFEKANESMVKDFEKHNIKPKSCEWYFKCGTKINVADMRGDFDNQKVEYNAYIDEIEVL